MTTPIEKKVLVAFSYRLQSSGVGETVIVAITRAYLGSSLPSADQLLAILRSTAQAPEGAG